MIDKKYLKSIKQKELEALLGVSERRIQQLHGEGLPRNGSGRGVTYDWEAVRGWEKDRIAGSGKDKDGLTDRQRKDRADADLAEMDRDKEAGNLLDASEARQTWEAFLGRLKDNLLGLADRCAPEIQPEHTLAERIAIVRRHVNGSLRDVVAQLQGEDRG